MDPNLEASLLSVLSAQKIGVETVIAKSSGPDHTIILKRIGIRKIISPEEDVAQQLAREIGNPRVHDYLQFQDGYRLLQMTVPEFFVGKSLRELNLREEHEIQVIGVQRSEDDEIDYVPSPAVPFEEDDVVWVTGPDEVLEVISTNRTLPG